MLFLIVFSLSVTTATSLDNEIQKLTHYAEEYETGNINYVQFMLYTSTIREKMNEALGAINVEGGILKQEQLESIFGEPTQMTKWVWVEGEEREKRLDKEIPAWEKIIFDGKKIQVWLNAFPSLFKRGPDMEERDTPIEEGTLIYRLHLRTEFKTPEEEFDISEKISTIKSLAEKFNSDPSENNAEELAKESINVERKFEFNMRQKGGECIDIMQNIFGSENRRETQKLFVQEITMHEGENFEAIARLEMCEECEWNWININLRIEGRGPSFKMPENANNREIESRERYKNMNFEDFEREAKELVEQIKSLLEKGDYRSANSLNNKFWVLNEAWNEKANNVWDQVNQIFEKKRESLSEEEMQKFNENYGWLKEEKARRDMVKQLMTENFEKRKAFYNELFADYDKKEFNYEQIEFEKRLVEEFKEFGEELCNNGKDDNNNGEIDCGEAQCGGKICGKEIVKKENGNETIEIEQELFCIEKECKPREEIVEIKPIACGNHICEEGEELNCQEDCAFCQKFEPIECSGTVIFKGKNNESCPLGPACIEEPEFCETDDDCVQTLCGKVQCVETRCKITQLEECREPECVDGQEKIESCQSGEQIVNSICINGLWRKTGIECKTQDKEKVCCEIKLESEALNQIYEWKPEAECFSTENIAGTSYSIVEDSYCEKEKPMECRDFCMAQPVIMTACEGEWDISGDYPNCNCNYVCKEIAGDKCELKSDCGNENDVCSNGRCVTIPEAIKVETRPIEHEDEEAEGEEVEDKEGEAEEKDEEEAEELEQAPSELEQEPTLEPEQEPEKETPPEPAAEPVTGNAILLFLRSILRITGFAVEGEQQVESAPENPVEQAPTEQQAETPQEPAPETQTQIPPESQPQPSQQSEEDERRNREEDESRDREDRERRESEENERRQRENKERCDNECNRICYDNKVRPCVDKCVRKECGEKWECDVDNTMKNCETSCKTENNIEQCVNDCSGKCMAGGEDWWKDFQEDRREEHKEEKGVFKAGGMCRNAPNKKKEAFIFFNGWGDPFERIERIKQRYYSSGQDDWCKRDYENLKKQRKEFETGFNQEFITWFFEKYLASSAEEWEQHISGIFELYWRDVEISREMSYRMDCLGKKQMEDYSLINIQYETEYGSIEFWEESRKVKLPGIEEEIEIISPYMKLWIFPPKSFIQFEMKKAMKEHEFPGPPEEKMERENENGPTEEEKKMIKQDKKFMKKIIEIADKYGGSFDGTVQFKDYEKDEIVFNLYVKVDKDNILLMKPMLPEELPEYDVKVEIDFEKIYDLISTAERDMRGTHIESPPWDQRPRPIQKIKEIINGIKMWFKIRSLMNSAEYYPEDAEDDAKYLFKSFFSMMQKSGPPDEEMSIEDIEKIKESEEDIWESKEKLTGEILRDF